MKFKKFEEAVVSLRKHNDGLHKLYDMNVDITEFCEEIEGVVDLLFREVYSEEQYDLIMWWIYEDVDKYIYDSKTGKMTDDLTKLKDLWKYIENKDNF